MPRAHSDADADAREDMTTTPYLGGREFNLQTPFGKHDLYRICTFRATAKIVSGNELQIWCARTLCAH